MVRSFMRRGKAVKALTPKARPFCDGQVRGCQQRGPRSDMQVDTHGVFPLKARISLTDRGSQELSSRAKGREEMCGGGYAIQVNVWLCS